MGTWVRRKGLGRACVTGAVVALALALGAGAAQALRIPEDTARRVQVHGFWSQEYLCLAARVPDTILTGTSTQPMSTPDQDDAIEFDFAIPNGPAHRLIISAAEGMTLLTRDTAGNWRSDTAWTRGPRTIKFAVVSTGTLNKPQDRDSEFTVEVAIPWEFLGGMPTAAVAEYGFNVVNWMQGENEGLVSWSPSITEPGDVGDVRRWGRMMVTRSSALLTAQGGLFPVPFSNTELLVDGTLSAPEWITASTLSFAKPEPQVQVTAPTTAQQAPFEALMAIYRYDWEPARFWKDGAPATVDQPKEGAGPWYRGQRVDWHREQVTEAKRAGIDILLVHYQGDAASRATWARTGLDRLTHALKEVRANDRSYPLIGLYLDTAALAGEDLKSEAGKNKITMMIRDFFWHVPREFRAELGAKPEQGRRGGVPVLLGEPTGLADWDESFMPYVEARVGRVTWLGSSAWEAKGVTGLYARVRLTNAGLTQDATGITAFTISPGYVPAPGTAGDVRPRRDGRAYRTDWQRLIAAAPSVIVVNSWNDFSNGTEIAPSRQYGYQYVDATRVARAELGHGQARSLRLLQHSAPEVLAPGVEYQVELLIENDSTSEIATGRNTSADYRITRQSDGQVLYERVSAQGLRVLAGQIRRTPVVITTRDQEGKPLPPGEYVFSLVVTKSRLAYFRSKLVAREEARLSVPFTVGTPATYAGTVVSTGLPSAVAGGTTTNVVVRVRNDGAQTWRKGEAEVGYAWTMQFDDAEAQGRPEEATAPPKLRTAPLSKEVRPGEIASVMVPVVAETTEVWSAPASMRSWHRRLAWSLVSGGEAKGALASEAVEATPPARGAVFQACAAPRAVEAGKTVEVEATVANGSTEAWPAPGVENSFLPGAPVIAATWFRLDGTGGTMTAPGTDLGKTVAPGEKVTAKVKLTAPATPGSYWVMWWVGGASPTGEAGPGAHDLLVTPMTVTGGGMRALDLTKQANFVASTTDAYRGRGAFDANGRSFPAECLAPDQSGAGDGLYPDGYYAPSGVGPHPVAFRYPSADAGMSAGMGCAGQSIALGEKGVRKVHLLAASAAGAQELAVDLRSEVGVARATVRVPSWREREEGTCVGAYAPYVRTLSGDEAAPAYLYHLTLEAQGATAMTLPEAPAVRILAITVEE